MKQLLLILLSFLFWTYSFSQKLDNELDYLIYSKAINEYISDYEGIDTIKTLVINRKKQKDNIDCEFAKEFQDSLNVLYTIYRELVNIDDSIGIADTLFINTACKLDSFNNKKIKRLKNSFDLNYQVYLISEFKIKYLFRNGRKDNWKTFYKKYPNSFGIIEVSNIAYSNDKNFAVFYIGYQRFGLMGYGCLLLIDLNKEDNIILKQVEIWIS